MKIYCPPSLEVLQVQVEKGFEGSGDGMKLPEWEII